MTALGAVAGGTRLRATPSGVELRASALSSSSGPLGPLSIVSSVAPFFFLTADLDVTVATGASVWADQSGNGRNATQAVAANQPALVASDPDFGGRSSLLADGTNDVMDVAWDPPAPGTQPVWFFFVFSQVSWTVSRFLFAGATASSVMAVFQTGTTPELVISNTFVRNNNAGAPVGTPARGQAYFSGTAADYLKLGPTMVASGVTAGTTDPAVFRIFSRNGSTQSMNAKMACIGAWAGEPSPSEIAALDAWVSAYYGGGVLT